MIRDSKNAYGTVSKINHWLSAIIVIALYFVGRWMVDLDYYNSWYVDAPNLHKSFGVLVALITSFRFLWKKLTPSPAPNPNHSINIQRLSTSAHYLMYLCLSVIFISGYLISTADGRAIQVFNLISIPALPTSITNQTEISGIIHEYATDLLMLTIVLHALAALKHHFIDKDNTLIRILK